MRRAATGLILGAVALIAASASAHPVRVGRYAEIPYGLRPDHPHPTARGDRARTGRLQGVAPAVTPVRLWQRALRNRTPRGPTVAADGSLYVGNRGGLTSLAPDGTERWHQSIGHLVAAPSLAPGGDVVAVSAGGVVTVVSPQGVVRRTFDLGAPARASPLVLDDGSVVVGTIDRQVHRLDANLRRVFRVTLGDGSNRNPLSLSRRGRMAASSGRMVWLLDPMGAVVRQVSLAGRATAAPVVADDGTLWVPTVEGVLHAIDPSGRVRSRTELGSRHYDLAAPAIGRDGAIRVPTLSGGLVCVGASGTVRWTAPNPNGYQAPASIDANDTTLVVDRGGVLRAIAADGRELWSVTLETFTYEAPVLAADGTLYVTTERGSVRAYAAPDAVPATPTAPASSPTAPSPSAPTPTAPTPTAPTPTAPTPPGAAPDVGSSAPPALR